MNTDIEIHYKNNDYGFMLAKDPNQGGKRLWKVTDTDILPPMYVTDKPQGAQTPVKKYDFIEQDWFYKGCGQTNLEDYYMYYTAGTADARVKGRVLPGPKYTKATVTGAVAITMPTITNGNFETGNTNGWTVSAGTLGVAGGGGAHAGSWGGHMNNAGAITTFYQDLTWSNDLRGKTVRVSVYVKVEAGRTATLSILDGVSFTNATSTDVAWAQITATRTLDAAATQLRIQCTIDAATTTTYWDDFTFLPTTIALSPVVKFIDFGGYHYVAAGNYLMKWDGTDWDVVYNTLYPITDLCVYPVSGTNYLFLAIGYSYYWWYTSNGTTFTESTVANAKAQFMSVCGSTLWFNSSAYQVRSATNPINGGSVSVTTDIRHSSKVITALPDHDSGTYIACCDGFYEIDGADVNSLLPSLPQEYATTTGKNAVSWMGNVYIPTGLSTLYEYDVANALVTNVSPSQVAPGISTFADVVTGLDGDSAYLLATVNNGTGIELIAGHWETINDETEWNWHHIGTLASEDCECIYIGSYNSIKRCWIGCTDGDIYYFSHPNQYGNFSSDTNYNMLTAGDFITSWCQGSYQYNYKDFYSITVHCTNLSATKTIAVSYKKEGETSFTSLGTLTSTTDNTLFFNQGVVTRKLQLKFTFASDSATSAPELNGYTLRATVRPFDQTTSNLVINEEGEFSSSGSLESDCVVDEYLPLDKAFHNITIRSNGMTTSKYITIQYKVDDDSVWTTLDTLLMDSPIETLYFPENTVGKIMYLKFTLSSPSDTSMVSYEVSGVLRPPARKVIDCTLYLSDKYRGNNGQIISDTALDKANILREIDDVGWPVTVKAFDGQQYNVTLKKITEEIAGDDIIKHPEYWFVLKMIEADIA